VLHVETEQEREVTQQLKHANDTIARLRDEFRDAAVREGLLQKEQVTWLRSLQEEIDNFRQRSAPLWEKVMKKRNSKISVLVVRVCMYNH